MALYLRQKYRSRPNQLMFHPHMFVNAVAPTLNNASILNVKYEDIDLSPAPVCKPREESCNPQEESVKIKINIALCCVNDANSDVDIVFGSDCEYSESESTFYEMDSEIDDAEFDVIDTPQPYYNTQTTQPKVHTPYVRTHIRFNDSDSDSDAEAMDSDAEAMDSDAEAMDSDSGLHK